MSLKRIDELFNFEKGVLQSSKSTPGNYYFITAAAGWKTHREYTHDCEALIFAAAASGSLGRTHYVNGKFISSDLCFIITPKDNKKLPVDLKFYHLLFNSLRDEIVRNTKAGTSKEAIGLTSFGKYEIPYFSIEKQKATKSKFMKVQELNINISDEFNLQQELLSHLRQSFLREAIRGKLVKQVSKDGHAKDLLVKIKAEKIKLNRKEKEQPPISLEEIPFDIPENWVWCRLGDVCINRDGSRIPLSMAERLLRQGEFDYYGAQGVIDKINDYKFDGTYLLIAEDGQNLLRKNKDVAFIASGKFWVNNHAHVNDFYDDSTREFIKSYINSINLKPFISGKPPSQIKLKRSQIVLLKLLSLLGRSALDQRGETFLFVVVSSFLSLILILLSLLNLPIVLKFLKIIFS